MVGGGGGGGVWCGVCRVVCVLCVCVCVCGGVCVVCVCSKKGEHRQRMIILPIDLQYKRGMLCTSQQNPFRVSRL